MKLLLSTVQIGVMLGCAPFAFCDTESELKSNFVYTFAKSSQVSQDRSGNASAPYVIGVFGDNEFIESMREAIASRSIGPRPIKIKHLGAETEIGQCNLVYFRATAHKRTADALRTAPTGIVLVGEEQGFLSQGGMINLIVERGKLRFEVNRGALERGNVRLDEKLFALAKDPSESSRSRRVRINVEPVYPDVARRAAIKGTVQLKVRVSGDGIVRGVDSIGGNPVLVEAAINAVKKWRFESTGRDTVELVKLDFN